MAFEEEKKPEEKKQKLTPSAEVKTAPSPKPIPKAPSTPKTDAPKKEETKETKAPEKFEAKKEDKKKESTAPAKTPEKKAEAKKSTTPSIAPVKKKDKAIAKGQSLRMAMKTGKYICAFISRKKIDQAIEDLEQVIKMKRPIPYKGEIPHRKGKGIMSGRYPVKASALMIKVLKALKGNVITNKMELEKSRIIKASASTAARPLRRGGREGKRTHIILEAREVGGKK